MGADQHLVITFKERADAVDLAAILAGCVAQVPFRGNGPVGPEAELGQRLVGKAGTDAFFRHDDDGLANALVRQLIERDEHEGRSEEHTSELQSLMRISSAVFCLKKKNK